MAQGSRAVVYAAVAGNFLVTITKFAAAAYTGSSAMLSEAIHSLVDTTNQLLLLYGIKRADRPPDETHPLGYGRELYFWSFVVALFMLTIGSGLTAYEGIQHILNPVAISNAPVSYFVLGISAILEGATLLIALREFRKAKGTLGYFEALRRSKNPPVFIVLFEDSAAMTGIFIALLGTFLAEELNMPIFDGIASLGISVLLFGTAMILAYESKELLIGEPASPKRREAIRAIARSQPGVEDARIATTVHLSPDQIVVALSLEFRDDLTTPQIEKIVANLDRAIHKEHPEVIAIFAKPQSRPEAANVSSLTEKTSSSTAR
ncbi:MAG: cation transporter [Pseudolabrys sp.]|nr:cation transporter [Pseudolabrys sp.]